MTSPISEPLTSRATGWPLAKKSDFRSTAGTPAGAANSCPRNPFWTRTSLAPLRRMMSPASSALKRVLTGTRKPPAVSRPYAAALVHPPSSERPGTNPDPLGQLGEREPQRPVDDRLRITEAVTGSEDNLRAGT